MYIFIFGNKKENSKIKQDSVSSEHGL